MFAPQVAKSQTKPAANSTGVRGGHDFSPVRVRTDARLRPHSADLKLLRVSAEVYARGKTPEVLHDGTVAELPVRPGGPERAAQHVREIHRKFGEAGLRQTLAGLQITRGNQFVLQMMATDPGVRGLIQPTPARQSLPAPVTAVLRSNEPGRPLPEGIRVQFESATGHDMAGVRVFDDGRSHAAAAAIGARAFTVGQQIFIGSGEYRPHSEAGQELLAHEMVHTLQQRGASRPASELPSVGSPGDAHEQQAEAAARSVLQFRRGTPRANDSEILEESARGHDLVTVSSLSTRRVQRAITFGTAVGTFTTNNVVANEDAAGFTLGSPVPTFQWQPDVTIHGDAGDVFADWETAHHQVGKGDWLNVWWGTGADRTHRHQTVTGGLPIRDATAAGNTWYSDFRAQGFAADGDVMSPIMRDTPSERIPWANPIAGRGGTRGWFNFGLGFVSTLSARHIPDGTGAAAFRHLNHVHWNFGVDGSFDTAAPVGGRVTMNGGAVNRSGMIPGIDVNNPPMHGGAIFGDNLVNTDT